MTADTRDRQTRYGRLWARRRVSPAATSPTAGTERPRIARDLHDSVVGSLDGIARCARVLVRMLDGDPGASPAVRDLARRLVVDAAGAGRAAYGLLSAWRDDEIAESLAVAVGRVATRCLERTRTAVDLHVEGRPQLPADDRYQLLEVLREALHNVTEHADASTVRVELRVEGGRVLLSVADDGRGFSVPPRLETLGARGCFGLIDMFERAVEVAATVTVHSRRGAGTTVVFRSAPASTLAAGQRWPPALVAVPPAG